MRKLNPDAVIKCSKDYIWNYRMRLDFADKVIFDSLLERMEQKGTGFLPVEEAMRFAYNIIDDIHILGSKIFPLQLNPFRPEHYDLRNSELNKKCATDVFISRKKLFEKPENVKIRGRQGQFFNDICVRDPDYSKEREKGADIYYLPWFFLDGENAFERKNNCEVPGVYKIKYGGKEIVVEGTPDALYRIGDGIVVNDYKITMAPPFHPGVGYVRQVTGYGMEAEQNSQYKAAVGMITYMEKLGKSFSIRHFLIDSKSDEGIKNRERTAEFADEIVTNIPEFESNPRTMLSYRNSIAKRCKGTFKPCYNYKFCWQCGLEDVIKKPGKIV